MIIKFNSVSIPGRVKMILFVKQNSNKLQLGKIINLQQARDFVNSFPRLVETSFLKEEITDILSEIGVDYEVVEDYRYNGPFMPEEAFNYMEAKNWYDSLPDSKRKFVDILTKQNIPTA